MFAVLWLLIISVLVPVAELQNGESKERVTHVQSVVNGLAKLPCDLTQGTDLVTLVIWYRAETEAPLYTLDARGRSLDHATHWADERTFGGRAFLRVTDGIAHLVLDSVREVDAGHYRCRVDFKKSPTRNSVINLTVVVPPRKVRILNEVGVPVTRPLVGPYSEGDSISLLCISEGGSPAPRVSWWLDNDLIDDSDGPGGEAGVVENELLLEQLSRAHAGRVYTCQAVNNALVDPVVADVKLDMFLKVLDVRLIGENLALSAGSEYEVSCQSTGSRPPAAISWWKAGQMLEQTREKTSPDGNVTVSTLTLTPIIEDLGKSLSCRGSNSKVPGSAREDTWILNVHYSPIVKLNLGSNINSSSIKEGVDVYMECSVRANPNLHRLSWKHNGKALTNNATAGIIVANQTLVLQSISRRHSGHYTCVATNSEGTGESNSFHLDVKYQPQCRQTQQVVYGAARGEVVSVTCEVDGNPAATMFRWTFNNSSEREREIIDFTTDETGGRSVATYSTAQGYGTLLCWGRNELGPQSVPCAFYVMPAGKPESPRNCTLRNKTQTALFVSCLRGFDGGLSQEFILEVYSSNGRLVVNQTSRVVPEFSVGGLEPGEAYVLNVYSGNAKGRSAAVVSVQVTTLRPTQQEHRRNIPLPAPTISMLRSMNPIMWVVVGLASGVALVGLLLLLVWRIRGGGSSGACCGDNEEDDTQHSSSGAESEDPKLVVHIGRGKGAASTASSVAATCHITAHDCLEMDDRNPDVIPLRNDVEQGSRTDLADEVASRCWRSSSDLQLPTTVSIDQSFQTTLSKHNLAYEVPAHLEKWTPQVTWAPSDQQPPPQYNLLLNKQNMVLVDPQSPLVLTTLAIESTVLGPSKEGADVALNPCILLKQPTEGLLTIPEHQGSFVQVLAPADPARVFGKFPQQQHSVETQTPLAGRHKESAV